MAQCSIAQHSAARHTSATHVSTRPLVGNAGRREGVRRRWWRLGVGEGVLHLVVMVEGKTFDIVSRHRGVLAWIPVRTYMRR